MKNYNFEHENEFYLNCGVDRISKFATHLDLFRRSSGLPGEIVEAGVFKGASLSRWVKFRDLLENTYSRAIYAFDTFGKFPEASAKDDPAEREVFVMAAGAESISRACLIDKLLPLGLNHNLYLIQGDICATIPDFARNNSVKISLLHIDVDLYEPTKTALEHLFPRVVAGGVIVLDDYGVFAGATLAIDEFFKTRNETIQKMPHSKEVAFIIKGQKA